MNKETALRAVIDELKYENRKMEFGSALYKLQKRVEELEETVEQLKNKI